MTRRSGVLYYQPATRGLANPDGARPVRYFGAVYRIPRSEHGSIRQLEWETSPAELRGDVTDGGVPMRCVDNTVMERFEVIDPESGDVWVMYRVPYEPAGGVA